MDNKVKYQILKIGRSELNNVYKIFNNDTSVSNFHCEIFIDKEGNNFLTDLNSTNGTFVNGNKIENPIKLEKNDILKLGNSLFNWQEYTSDLNSKLDSLNLDSCSKAKGTINNLDYNYEKKVKIKRINYSWFFLLLIPFFLIILNNKSNKVFNDKVKSSDYIPPTDISDINDDIVIPISLPTARPINGFSPYNNYYGNGIYDNSAGNIIKVTAPISKDIVIMFKDIYSNRMIRNEYIRAGNLFSLTGVPYGNYKFFYIYGDDWSANADFKRGLAKGNFLKNKGVGKSDKFFDVEFENGFYGTYSLTLQLMSNGNLITVEGSEDDL